MKKKCLILMFGIFICLGALFTGCGKQAEKYKIEFVVDNGIYATIETAGNEQLQLPTEPTKIGFDFGGWYFDLDTWQQVFSADSFINKSLKNDTKVYAKWIEQENENLNANFEGFDKIDNLIYSKKVSNTTENVYLTDYVSVDRDCTWKLCTNIQATDIIPSKVATLNIGDNTYYVLVEDSQNNVKIYTLQIRRKPLYEITFDTDGGNEIKSQYVEEDSFINLTITPQKAYHYFLGWDFDFDNAVNSDMQVKALWEENKITYFLDNGTNGNNPINYNTNDIISLQNASKTGYTFQGWFNDSNYCDKLEQINTTYGNINLYAKFTANPYNITLDACGGDLGVDNLQVIYDSNYELPIPVRDKYYRFEGWFDNNDNKFESGQWQTANDVTLHAKWLGKFVFENGTILGITDYGNSFDNLQIPSEIEGKSVNTIGDSAFQKTTTAFKQIILPKTIKSIGNNAFAGCVNLESIYIYNSLENMGEQIFTNSQIVIVYTEFEEKPNNWEINKTTYWGVKRENIIFEDNFEYIVKNNDAILSKYYGNEDIIYVKQQVLGNTITVIGSYAFANKRFTEIYINENVTNINSWAFYKCDKIKKMKVPFIGTTDNEYPEHSHNNLLGMWFGYTQGQTEEPTIHNCTLCNTKFFIPTTLKYLEISGGEFVDGLKGCSLKVVKFGENVAYVNIYTIPNTCALILGKNVQTITSNSGKQHNIYFNGSKEEYETWVLSLDPFVSSLTTYFYVENTKDLPDDNFTYWHYDIDGITPVLWN